MGVKGLWALIEPVARPVRVESLRNKRLAIDASIWLHQFLKAMRDAEGKTLSNAHILGFFRRICKLLFFNIKPVFVFDGGAPTLKRSTIRERKERKERTTKNLQKTAEKLLSAQLRLHALNQVKDKEISPSQQGLTNIATADAGRRKRDAYELPVVDTEFRISVEQDRMLALEEGEDYVIHGIDTENIDLDSEVFTSLPVEIQQEILLDLKNKSRQTSWNRLEHMIRSATTAFDFSQLQIKNLVRRNDLMQRFLESTGATNRTSTIVKGRIASETDREYVLIRNDDVAGGWTMGIKSKKQDPNAGTKETPVKLDSSDEDEDFEEVEIPGITKPNSVKPTAEVPFFNSSLEPLRRTQASSLVNDMGSYVDDDESIDAVMERFKKLEEATLVEGKEVPGLIPLPSEVNNDSSNECSEKLPDPSLFVSKEQVYDYWVNQAPPEFKVNFPLYEILLKEAVYDFSEEARNSIILSFTRKLEKTSDDGVSRDKVVAYSFYIAFCRFVNEWKNIWEQMVEEVDLSEEPQSTPMDDIKTVAAVQTEPQTKEKLSTPIKKQNSAVDIEQSSTRFASQFESSYEIYSSDTENSLQLEEESFSLLSQESYSLKLDDISTKTPKVDENDLDQLCNIDFSSSFLQRDAELRQETAKGSSNTVAPLRDAKADTNGQNPFVKTSRIASKFFKSPVNEASKSTSSDTEIKIESDPYTEKLPTKNESSILESLPKEELTAARSTFDGSTESLQSSKPSSPRIDEGQNTALHSIETMDSLNTVLSAVKGRLDSQEPLEPLLNSPVGITGDLSPVVSASNSPSIKSFSSLANADNELSHSPKQNDHRMVSNEETASPIDVQNLVTPIKRKSDLALDLTTPTFSRSQTELSSGRSEQPLYISPETIKIISSGGLSMSKHSLFDHRSQVDTSPTKSRKIVNEPADTSPTKSHNIENEPADMSPTKPCKNGNEPAETSTTELFDSEDEDVSTHLDQENSEFAQFVSALKNKDIDSVHRELENEVQELNSQIKRGQRDVSNPNNNMIADIQDLLRLFGIPYVVAPMEAEAQCAELLKLSLVDGVVTDDSDVFLFGATKIYRNMFNQAKFVECYQSSDLEREMKLDQEKLISLAYLLGSDYTEGVSGIGVVNAMEILNEWSGEEGLERFRDWWKDLTSISTDSPVRKKLRNILKKCYIPSSFPDRRVREAYINPMVDDSDQKFQWGIPDLDGLRGYMQDKLRWPESKTDETLIPIIKNINQRKVEGNQTTLDGFLGPTPGRTPTHKSARIRDIVSQWVQGSQNSDTNTSPTKRVLDSDSTPDESEEEMEVVPVAEPPKTRGRGRGKGRGRGTRGATKTKKALTRRTRQ
ncbi:PIN domain-like protein [Basidiobolus meristosporus CBS 931.73]|uniref:PIN domain-like protein n=1 Tax=Basidiobolus meristosporus CBS 931.73 TaxID=1314790 RepID=A0A1Y1Z520_9FUNG|nr:PIN domain-like protein [Basidiobolus meristosporus CBS 931.73]|eukprot:ORY04915.1 PIN domain-like protein [Basidiobolus meristosporus CBS 931.73]